MRLPFLSQICWGCTGEGENEEGENEEGEGERVGVVVVATGEKLLNTE